MINGQEYGPFKPLPPSIDVSFDMGGVDGKTMQRKEEMTGVTSLNGPIDVNDTAFRQAHFAKWQRVASPVLQQNGLDAKVVEQGKQNQTSEFVCGICKEGIDIQVCSSDTLC